VLCPSPPTLTRTEQRTILRVSARNLRDHPVYSLAMGTGLRLSEIVGLNTGEVYLPKGLPRTPIRLRPEIVKNDRAGDVFLRDALLAKFRKFWRQKVGTREGLQPEDALFCSQRRTRISPRRVQFSFRTWQVRGGFDRLYPFHSLRHSAITAVYRASRDLFLAQRFARHVSPLTTTVYTHPSDQELWASVRWLNC